MRDPCCVEQPERAGNHVILRDAAACTRNRDGPRQTLNGLHIWEDNWMPREDSNLD